MSETLTKNSEISSSGGGGDRENKKRYSVSRSGRFKEKHKQREALDSTLFKSDENGNEITDNNINKQQLLHQTSSNQPQQQQSQTHSKKRSYSDIEAWIEKSFSHIDGSRRKKSGDDGTIETAL